MAGIFKTAHVHVKRGNLLIIVTLLGTLVLIRLIRYLPDIAYLSRPEDKMSSDKMAAEIIAHARKSKSKVILLWDAQSWFLQYVNSSACSETCSFIHEKSLINEVDAVVFDAQILKRLPSKKEGQVWVFFTLESPSNCPYDMTQWNKKFNWTWTYRRDSDFITTYGEFFQRKAPLQQINLEDIYKKKTKDVLWIVSNCDPELERTKYVEELKRVTDVTVFGKCGEAICPRNGTRCTEGLINGTYRYYLSFENSLCRDYITEKAFSVMTLDIIPIVRGGYNVSQFIPNGSFIDSKSFNKTMLLSNKLQALAEDHHEYAKYFTWRKYFEASSNLPDTWCNLCDKLRNPQKIQPSV